jgi:hypothetical protein
MHWATAARFPDLMRQLSNRVKTAELRAAQVSNCILKVIAKARASTLQTTLAMACPVFVALVRCWHASATMPMIKPIAEAIKAIGNKMNEIAATRLTTPITNAATPRPLPGRPRRRPGRRTGTNAWSYRW